MDGEPTGSAAVDFPAPADSSGDQSVHGERHSLALESTSRTLASPEVIDQTDEEREPHGADVVSVPAAIASSPVVSRVDDTDVPMEPMDPELLAELAHVVLPGDVYPASSSSGRQRRRGRRYR